MSITPHQLHRGYPLSTDRSDFQRIQIHHVSQLLQTTVTASLARLGQHSASSAQRPSASWLQRIPASSIYAQWGLQNSRRLIRRGLATMQQQRPICGLCKLNPSLTGAAARGLPGPMWGLWPDVCGRIFPVGDVARQRIDGLVAWWRGWNSTGGICAEQVSCSWFLAARVRGWYCVEWRARAGRFACYSTYS